MPGSEIFFRSTRLLVHYRRVTLLRRFISRIPDPPGKPPLLPPAKGKRYTIVHVPWQDFETVKELLWRRHIYNDAVASYRAMYKRLNEEQMKGATGEAAIQRREDEEFQRVLLENDEENRRIADRRKIRINERIRKIEDDTLREIDSFIHSEQENLLQREADVLAMVERSKDFVTLDNMEEKILEALEKPNEYNHAVDIDGNVYEGDKFMNYLNEMPLAETPVSEVTASLRKIGRYEEGSGKIVDLKNDDSISAVRI